MQDYIEDLPPNHRRVSKRISDLQGRLRTSSDSLSRKNIVDELSKLEQQRMTIDNVVVGSGDDRSAEDYRESYPSLAELEQRYRSLRRAHSLQVRELQSLLLYLRYFDDEFIGLFSERRLKLDVKYSVERDGFYHHFSQLSRRVGNYCDEAMRVQEGNYAKSYQRDLMKRIVEMRHAVVIEAAGFFRRVYSFTEELIDDLDGDGILCQNGDAELSYSELDRETELRGMTVRAGLQHLFDACDEILGFLDVPDFQR